MTISKADWENYIRRLSRVSETASKAMQAFMSVHPSANVEDLIRYAYGLTTRYGEAAAALACEMYDAVAAASGAAVASAEPAEVATAGEVTAAVRAVHAESPNLLPAVTERMVKRAAADTTLKNAIRDGAEFAWVPHGDTCAFCIMLASNGWQPASRKALKGGHAQHIHSHCDCEYAIRFDSRTEIAGYDPDAYLERYQSADGTKWQDKLNAMRREDYATHADEINAQKRAARERRKNLRETDKHGIIYKKPETLRLGDIAVGRSVGAKAQNYEIMDLATGEYFNLTEGSHLQNVEVFAGKGVRTPYRKAPEYAEKFGGSPDDWQHVKAIGEVDYYGEARMANIHWSQCEGFGKHDFFIKEWLE